MIDGTSLPISRRSALGGILAGSAAIGLALSGCASGTPSSESGSGSSAGTGSASASGASSASSGAAEEAVLTAALSSLPTAGPDPVGNTSAPMLAAAWHVFEGLYDLDYHTYHIYNALAAGAPEEIGELQYAISLRENATFSNGIPVTVDDVVASFALYMANPTYAIMLDFIDSIVAEESRVVFTFKYPFNDLFQKRLTLVKIVSEWQSDEERAANPIGTGPWMFSSIGLEDGEEIVFEKNTYYNGTLPVSNFKKMRWLFRSDDEEREKLIRDGEAQVVEHIHQDDYEKLSSDGVMIERVLGLSQPILLFNCAKKPFNDARVRRAFFYAIDADKLVSNIMNGCAKTASCILPKTYPDYHGAETVYTHDTKKAKALLEQAEIEELEITLRTSENWVGELASSITSDLQEVGISVIRDEANIDWAALSSSAASSGELPFDVILCSGDPSCLGNDADLIMSWWYGDNEWTQGRSCWALAEDGKFEQMQTLLAEARTAEKKDRQSIWNKCFNLIASEVPLYPLFHREAITGFLDDKVSGFEAISTSGLSLLGTSLKQ